MLSTTNTVLSSSQRSILKVRCVSAYLDDMGGGSQVQGHVAIVVTESKVDVRVREGLKQDVEGVWVACLRCIVERGVSFEVLLVDSSSSLQEQFCEVEVRATFDTAKVQSSSLI